MRRSKRDKFVKTMKGVSMMMCLLMLFCVVGTIETTYKREATVVSIDNDVVVCEDTVGYTWEVLADGLAVGQEVILIMDTNTTDSVIDDDTVKDIKVID